METMEYVSVMDDARQRLREAKGLIQAHYVLIKSTSEMIFDSQHDPAGASVLVYVPHGGVLGIEETGRALTPIGSSQSVNAVIYPASAKIRWLTFEPQSVVKRFVAQHGQLWGTLRGNML